MIELERHIEILLLNNDCVIVPDFGGFMTQHIDARFSKEDNTFLPPIRTIGFNPQLKINDSLLAQSYVEAYDISYPEALRRIEQEVEELRQILESEGSYELSDIGTLRLNAAGNYEFDPCEAGLLTPNLYGLSSFEMETLEQRQAKVDAETAKVVELNSVNNDNNIPEKEAPTAAIIAINDDNDSYTIRKSVIRNIAIACIALLAFLLVPSNLGNSTKTSLTTSRIDTGLLYRIMPKDITTGNNEIEAATKKVLQRQRTEEQQAIIEELQKQEVQKEYFSIVLASKVTRTNAEAYVTKLQKSGYSEAQVYSRNGSTKVVYGKYSSESEAYRALNKLNNKKEFSDSWVTKVRN